MIFTKLWYILFDCICITVNTFVPLLYSKIKITWSIYHLASEWTDAFVYMKRKYGKCLEIFLSQMGCQLPKRWSQCKATASRLYDTSEGAGLTPTLQLTQI